MERRSLGTGEYIWHRIGELESNNVAVMLQVKGSIEESNLRAALRVLVDAQSVLRLRSVSSDGKLAFEVHPIEELPLRVVTRSSDARWESLIEEELNDPIKAGAAPLWRLTWLAGDHRSELVLTFNHMMADGRTAVLFFDYLLEKMKDPDFEIPPGHLAPAYESQLDSRSWREGVVQGAKAALRIKRGLSRTSARIPKSTTRESDARTKVLYRTVEPEALKRLVAECREQGTSVTGALGSAMGRVLTRQIPVHGEEALAISVAVDTRRFCKAQRGDDLGYYVAASELVMSGNNASGHWDLAREFKHQLVTKSNAPSFKVIRNFRRLGLALKSRSLGFRQFLRNSISNAALITNLGRVDLKRHYGDIQVVRLVPIPSVHFLGIPYLSVATATHDGVMDVSLSFPAHLIEQDVIETWADMIMESLRRPPSTP